jgi:hypothetical protein
LQKPVELRLAELTSLVDTSNLTNNLADPLAWNRAMVELSRQQLIPHCFISAVSKRKGILNLPSALYKKNYFLPDTAYIPRVTDFEMNTIYLSFDQYAVILQQQKIISDDDNDDSLHFNTIHFLY